MRLRILACVSLSLTSALAAAGCGPEFTSDAGSGGASTGSTAPGSGPGGPGSGGSGGEDQTGSHSVTTGTTGSGGSDCGDTSNSATNCGYCGHDCLGATCVEGFCTPTVVASDQTEPVHVTVDALSIYWAEQGRVWRRLKGTPGETKVVAEGLGAVLGLVVDGTHVYFTDGTAQVISRRPKDGSEIVVPVVLGEDFPKGLAGDEIRLFWIGDGGSTIRGGAKAPGGDAATTFSLATGASALVCDGSTVYWTSSAGGVFKPDGADKPGMKLGESPTNAHGLAQDATHLYWTYKADGGGVRSVKKDGTGAKVLSGAEPQPEGIAVDTTHVYWATNTAPNGEIVRMSKTGGDREVLVKGLNLPRHVAVDAVRVYFTVRNTASQGQVLSVPK